MRRLTIFLIIAAVAHYFMNRPTTVERLMDTRGNDAVGGVEVIEDAGGPDFDLSGYAKNGQITVVEFSNPSCGACQQMTKVYDQLLPIRPDVAVKRIILPEYCDEDCTKRKYGLSIQTTPNYVLFDTEGEIIAADDGADKSAYKLFIDWFNAEVKKDWEAKNPELVE